MTEIISATILLVLIMDPLGNLPIFMSVLKNFQPKRQRIILIREMVISLFIMLLFLFSGERILAILNLKTETVVIAGGIILFLIAIKMIFPDYTETINESEDEPFLVPLAIPLVAGPSLLATLMLLAHQYKHKIFLLIGSLFIAWTISLIILLSSEIFLNLFGSKGVNALEKLMGLVLIMISIQMLLDGFHHWIIS
ncbi:dITP- and XTP- hydrolase [Buchnera aphidicola (Nipponaphis monzeni)]|uniref:UPF0056 membrane protein n=1 Tax=Buchnera aphidicola (Nipponaphis monzeni) TaxID=2495405 RepID=A0A455TAH9_9GAMM|nr:YhgN family NAAT transporter [Buchnera aphidicola]BBI01344.1 dITP- and XTP- hydrolase [Buchnera aphidicola (Nipponaphis monzeni)]